MIKTTPDQKFGQLLAVGHDYRYGGMEFQVLGACADLTRAELNDLIVTAHYALKALTDMWMRANEEKACQTTNQ